MVCKNLMKKLSLTLAMAGCLVAMTSCSESSMPGGLAPTDISDQQSGTPRNEGRVLVNGIKPVKAKATGLAIKGSYATSAVSEVQASLQTIVEELQLLEKGRANLDYLTTIRVTRLGVSRALRFLKQRSPQPNDLTQCRETLERTKNFLSNAVSNGTVAADKGALLLDQLESIWLAVGQEEHDACRGTNNSTWINKFTGGEIEHCGHGMQVPSHALPESKNMSISVLDSDDVIVDFGPDGWFNRPVTIRLNIIATDLAGIDPDKLLLAWYDEEAGFWYGVNTRVDLENMTLTARVWHFTRYTLSVE